MSPQSRPVSMNNPRPERIEQISTRHEAVSDPTKFVFRYSAAISAYLNALVRDEDIAQEVLQDFLLQIVAKGFGNRDTSKGRFRDYLKVAVRNAALSEIRRRKVRQTVDVDVEKIEVAAAADDVWLRDWRKCLLDVGWRELERLERASETNFGHSILRIAVEHNGEDSSELATRASEVTGHSFSPDSFRKQLSRARRRFAEVVRRAIAETLECPTDEAIENEIADLRLAPFLASS